MKDVNISLSSQPELCIGPHRNYCWDGISSVATISQIELVSVDSGKLLKVITSHFHFDSNARKKHNTHPAIAFVTVKSISNSFLVQKMLFSAMTIKIIVSQELLRELLQQRYRSGNSKPGHMNYSRLQFWNSHHTKHMTCYSLATHTQMSSCRLCKAIIKLRCWHRRLIGELNNKWKIVPWSWKRMQICLIQKTTRTSSTSQIQHIVPNEHLVHQSCLDTNLFSLCMKTALCLVMLWLAMSPSPPIHCPLRMKVAWGQNE